MGVPDKYDIAIVGGGIAGLYCGLQADPDKNVALFESTDRIGGRIETVSMEGFNTEYGAMRFDPSKQLMTGKLIQDLGLETETFHEYSCPTIQNRRTIYNLEEYEKELTTIDLVTFAIQRVLNMSREQIFSMTEEELEHIRREGKHNGEYLWKQGLWNIFSDVLSYDALKYIIMDGTFFHFVQENPNIDWMINWIKMLQMSKGLKGIKHGMQRITDSMLEKIKEKGVEVYKNHTLAAIMPSGKDEVALLFDNHRTVSAKHVILAIPQRSLKSIKNIPENIKKLLGSVMEIPLLKCFFVVKDPWWEQDITNEGLIPFPARELHYSKKFGKGNIMVYADRPYINFWSGYVNAENHEEAEMCGDKELPLMFARRMNIDPGNIIMYGIRDWSRDPYGAACHLWRPGVQSWKVSEKLEAFSLSEGGPKNVHICGEAFSNYQGFMEGSVRSAHNVMTKIQL